MTRLHITIIVNSAAAALFAVPFFAPSAWPVAVIAGWVLGNFHGITTVCALQERGEL